ncbi:hypothetical protein DPMN_101989 [Dreissena polymorpha]|uniref:Uncharacterized protein n=1 Tax=Dreissena polymorpha TaxID=45954 RepID=A0A9D4LKU1_DREPO|nr:hypothetical protein DPMN_101989 [Dreissena polymorpha]
MNNQAILEGATSLTPPSIAFSSIQFSTGKCWKKITNIIRKSYEGLTCRIVYDRQPTDDVDVKNGMRKAKRLEAKHGIQSSVLGKQLDDLDFADDLDFLSHTQQYIQDKHNITVLYHRETSKVFMTKALNNKAHLISASEALEDDAALSIKKRKKWRYRNILRIDLDANAKLICKACWQLERIT